MKVQISLVGFADHTIGVKWPDGWPVPREGEEVHVPGQHGFTPVVRTVCWFPHGDPDDREFDPFVYVVVGPKRPE